MGQTNVFPLLRIRFGHLVLLVWFLTFEISKTIFLQSRQALIVLKVSGCKSTNPNKNIYYFILINVISVVYIYIDH